MSPGGSERLTGDVPPVTFTYKCEKCGLVNFVQRRRFCECGLPLTFISMDSA